MEKRGNEVRRNKMLMTAERSYAMGVGNRNLICNRQLTNVLKARLPVSKR